MSQDVPSNQLLDTNNVWTQVCADLQLKLSRAVYNTWIATNTLTHLQETNSGLQGVILSPTAYHSNQVQKNFFYDLKQTLEKVTGKKLDIQFKERRPGDPDAIYADNAKAKSILGWEPQYKTIESIIETAWAWHSKHPNGYK